MSIVTETECTAEKGTTRSPVALAGVSYNLRKPMISEKHTTYLRFVGALLGVPAAAAGSYSVYQSYFATDVVCRNLRSGIVTIIEKNVPVETKRGLMLKDVAEFEKTCSKFDPDSLVIFQAALQPERQPQHAAPAMPPSGQIGPAVRLDSTAGSPTARAPQTLRLSVANFGLSLSGERRGWVSLTRREPDNSPESQFDGYAVTDPALPAVGSMLTARHMLPVWIEPLKPGPNDPTKLQGRLTVGACVRVLATRPGPVRRWAEVTPMNCP